MAEISFLNKVLSAGGHYHAGEVTCWQSGRYVGKGTPEWIVNGLGKVPTFTRSYLVGLPIPYADGEIIEGIHDADYLYVQAPVGWIYVIEAYG